ncbi:MAG: FG-GAP repeat protein [Verrucomicrobia bacterium]|nr:FG-GAP repeat protein [Verrucomicrobiota bacterium]
MVATLPSPEVWAAPAQSGRAQEFASASDVPEGLSAPDWSSIRRQYEQHRHAAFPVASGYQARNPGQQWQTRFDGQGFTTQPDGAAWQWGLGLQSYGFAGSERAVSGKPRVTTAGQRVTYDWDATLQEWFVNDQHGLEHGFTVKHRPVGASSLNAQPSTLNFLLAVRGGLRPRVRADGRGVHFIDAQGAAALTYSGLTVLDADGRKLPARFEPVNGGASVLASRAGLVEKRLVSSLAPPESHEDIAPCLRLVIDERDARYPLTIDPIAQQAYLKASNTGGWFGTSVAVSGDTVVVGASLESSSATGVDGDQSDNSAHGAGGAYVFVRNGTNWSQQAYLKASNTDAGDGFGAGVAVSGDTVVVTAYHEGSSATGVNGDQSDNSAPSAGAAYVFVRSGTNWTQQAYLKASNTEAEDWFGMSVAVSGDTVVVGTTVEASNATGVDGDQSDNSAALSGAAYVFVRAGTNWSQQAYLKASNSYGGSPDYPYGDLFGLSVAVSSDTVLVGAPAESSSARGLNGNQNDNSASASGAAYVFVRNGTTWSQQAYLKASNTDAYDGFGYKVALSGDTLVVGADGEDSSARGVNGNQSNNSAQASGAAYVFVRNGTTWTQQAYLKASNSDANDSFGVLVAVSGGTVVVGAYGELSNATGVNGDQSNNNSPTQSGATYVFTGLGLGTRLALERDGSGGYFLRFTGAPDVTYRLQRAPSVTGPWSTLVTNTAPSSGLIEYHETSPPPGAAFYRTAQP